MLQGVSLRARPHAGLCYVAGVRVVTACGDSPLLGPVAERGGRSVQSTAAPALLRGGVAPQSHAASGGETGPVGGVSLGTRAVERV